MPAVQHSPSLPPSQPHMSICCYCRPAGEDFNRNLYIKTLDFATVHCYPKSFGVPNTSFEWVNDFMLGEQAAQLRITWGDVMTGWHALSAFPIRAIMLNLLIPFTCSNEKAIKLPHLCTCR